MTNSRRKGAQGEREAAKEIQRIFGVEARRGRQYHGRDDAPDIVADIPGVHFEVKRVEKLRLYKALEQAANDSAENVPCVLHRKNGEPWVIALYLDDVVEFASEIMETCNAK